MSITITTDVFCDRCESNWIFGYVGTKVNKNAARESAKREGWSKVWNKQKERWEDICPRCEKT